MAKQNLNYGSSPNDGTGDNLRNASIKIQSNFDELYARGLQEVTDAGNIIADGMTYLILSANGVNVNDDNGGSAIYFDSLQVNGVSSGIDIRKDEVSFYQSTNSLKLKSDTLSGNRTSEFPDFNVKLNGCTAVDNYTNDTTAAAGGIAIGQMYHTAGVVKIRLT